MTQFGEASVSVAGDGEGFDVEEAFVEVEEGGAGVLGFVEEFEGAIGGFFFAAFGLAFAVAGFEIEEGGFSDFEGEANGSRLGDELEDNGVVVDFEEGDDGGLLVGGELIEAAAAFETEGKFGGGFLEFFVGGRGRGLGNADFGLRIADFGIGIFYRSK